MAKVAAGTDQVGSKAAGVSLMRIAATVLWAAMLAVLGWYTFMEKAPAIERDIDARVTGAVSPLNAGVNITVDGRSVTLRGPVENEEQRVKLVEAADNAWGALVTDAMWVPAVAAAPVASPEDDGRVTQLEGQVADLKLELEAARARIAELTPDTSAPADEDIVEAAPEPTPPFTVGAGEAVPEAEVAAAEVTAAAPAETATPQQAIGTCNEASARLLRETSIDFDTASATVPPAGLAIIDRLVDAAKPCITNDKVRVTVGGHTDSQGQTAANLKLSQDRAEAVKAALAQRGVKDDEITAIGFGASMPIADNATEEGRRTNRRITIEWSLR